MKNVLVLGVGGNVSLGILKVVRRNFPEINLFGSCVNEKSFAMYLCDEFFISPYANSEKFIPWLLEKCNIHNIDLVLTGVEEVIYAIAKNYKLLKHKCSSNFVCSDFDKIEIGQDKYLTSKWLKENNCNYPLFARMSHETELKDFFNSIQPPYLLKPRKGKGSSGIKIVENKSEISKFEFLEDYVVQEYIGSETKEYTVGCFINKDGQVFEPIVMRRELQNGATSFAEIVKNESVSNEAIKICSKFQPSGPLNIQLRTKEDGTPVCFELNVRFSGTTPIRDFFGFKDLVAVINEHLFGISTSNFNVSSGKSIRYSNEVYFKDGSYSPNTIFVEEFGMKK